MAALAKTNQVSGVDTIKDWMQDPMLAGLAKGLQQTNLKENTTTNSTSTTNTVQQLVEQIQEQQLRQWQEQINESMTEVITRGDPASMASLQQLIQTLAGGGTPEQIAQRAARAQEIERARAGITDYSKEKAFSDAQGASQAANRQAMEQSMANLSRAIAGSGTSGSSMQALLAQQAARNAAELQAKMQLEASTQYGGIATQYQSILEALTRPDNSQVDSLLAALQLAMNANQSTTRNVQTNKVGQEQTDKTTNRTQNVTTDSVTKTLQDTLRTLSSTQLSLGGGGGGGSGGGGRIGSYGGIPRSSGGLPAPAPSGIYGAGNLGMFGTEGGSGLSGFTGTGDSYFGGGSFADGTSVAGMAGGSGPIDRSASNYYGD